MNIVPAIGSICMGIVVGWLIRFFLTRFKKFSPQVLGTVVGIMLGGATIKFLEADPSVWWFYPIGLLIGFVVYSVVAALSPETMKDFLFLSVPHATPKPVPVAPGPGPVDLSGLFEAELTVGEHTLAPLIEHRQPLGEELLGDQPDHSYSKFVDAAQNPAMFEEVLQMLQYALERERSVISSMHSQPAPDEPGKPDPFALRDSYRRIGDLGRHLASAARNSRQCTFNPSSEQTTRYIKLGFALKQYMLARKSG